MKETNLFHRELSFFFSSIGMTIFQPRACAYACGTCTGSQTVFLVTEEGFAGLFAVLHLAFSLHLWFSPLQPSAGRRGPGLSARSTFQGGRSVDLTGGKILDADDKVVSSEMVPLTHMGASSINATAGEAAFRLLTRTR